MFDLSAALHCSCSLGLYNYEQIFPLFEKMFEHFLFMLKTTHSININNINENIQINQVKR